MRVSALQTDLPELLRIAERHGATLVGRAGLGLSWLRLDDGAPGELVSELRGRWTCAVVLDRPAGLAAPATPAARARRRGADAARQGALRPDGDARLMAVTGTTRARRSST